ncbi:MAG: hypothetical protein R3283_03960, partial [Balneolaceae bacterium]|nr:hypothetical protein [Balneolaceae bacterium]
MGVYLLRKVRTYCINQTGKRSLWARRAGQLLPAVITALLLVSCSMGDGKVIVDDSALADQSLTSEWLAYGGTHYEQRFSPLEDVTTENVSELKVDWYLDLPNDVGLVSTPLVVNGVMYFTGTMNI